MAIVNKNLSFIQNAQCDTSWVGKTKYQVCGRISSLGTSLLLLAETVGRAALACLAAIAFAITLGLWHSAFQLAKDQMHKAKITSSNSLTCFIAVFSPKSLCDSVRQEPLVAATQAACPLAIVTPQLHVKPLDGAVREHRMQWGASLIQRKLQKELQCAAKQMREEMDDVNFQYQARKLGPAKSERVGEYEVGISHCRGLRPTMEDEDLTAAFNLKIGDKNYPIRLFGIFDGHGGDEAAKYLKAYLREKLEKTLLELNPEKLTDEGIWNALKMTFVRLNQEFQGDAGSTATVSMILDGKLWTANVGDSRTILVKSNGEILQLSEDADPADPRYQKGIKNRGGRVVWRGCCLRVNGAVAVGRAFGDRPVGPGMSTRPKITAIPLADIPHGSFLVQACDGIWDVASTRQVGGAIYTHGSEKPITLAQSIVASAYYAQSSDNLSAMVVRIP